MYNCRILADSINHLGHRLTTFEVTFPRFILAEVNTHRMLSRNSASSRAIPVKKSIQAVRDDPFIPESFGENQAGMSWSNALDEENSYLSRGEWRYAIEDALRSAGQLEFWGVHKSLANRILEPFKWHTAILSGTDWTNLLALRTDANTQPEFRKIALMMREAYHEHEPRELTPNEWHLPLVSKEEIQDEALRSPEPGVNWELWQKVSIGRCARVSYLTHDGKRDLEADVALHDRLKTNGHLSPFEHVARPFTAGEWSIIHDLQDHLGTAVQDPFRQRLARNLEYCGNFHGWHQARADIVHEDDFSLAQAS